MSPALIGIGGVAVGVLLMWPAWLKKTKIDEDLERERVRNAGCLSIAEGVGMDQMPAKGDWAWSPALQAVYDLRRDYDYLKKLVSEQQDTQALQRAETPVRRETTELPKIWDQRLEAMTGRTQIPYEELEHMFLDQFLLRWFADLMPDYHSLDLTNFLQSSPWEAFLASTRWTNAKYAPLLFQELTGYKLNDIQLNNAIADWARRCGIANRRPITHA